MGATCSKICLHVSKSNTREEDLCDEWLLNTTVARLLSEIFKCREKYITKQMILKELDELKAQTGFDIHTRKNQNKHQLLDSEERVCQLILARILRFGASEIGILQELELDKNEMECAERNGIVREISEFMTFKTVQSGNALRNPTT